MSRKQDLEKIKELEKTLKETLNELEILGQNPTPIRRVPDTSDGIWVIGWRTNRQVIQWNPSRKKWVSRPDLVEKFPESEVEK